MKLIKFFLAAVSLFLGFRPVTAVAAHFYIETSATLVDGTAPAFKNLKPGDTIFFRGGQKDRLLIRNVTGDAKKPVFLMNCDGTVLINTDWYYGIVLQQCRYVRLSGTGDRNFFYGFMITRVKGGAGISVGTLSSDVELDHIYISNCSIAGIYAKTDPDCSFASTRDKFVQNNTVIHDCSISNVGNEGMYIGSSFYSGETMQCNGKDTLVFPHLLSGVRIYNNIVRNTGWDGIQVGSASVDCKIYNNLVEFDSQAGTKDQMSGILIGGGSDCDCYNNYIYKGKGDGIESLGLGGYRIYNNIIVDAGYNFEPDNPDREKHGIYQGDVSTRPGSSYFILFNDIINPKTDGIRFNSLVSRNNLIASNVIIHPGGGSSAYIKAASSYSISEKNNYQAMSAAGCGFQDTLYSLKPGSPLIDAGYSGNQVIAFDFNSRPRPFGKASDQGAQEYNGNTDPPKQMSIYRGKGMEVPNLAGSLSVDPVVFPNPAVNSIVIRYYLDTAAGIGLDVYTMEGNRVLHSDDNNLPAGNHQLAVRISDLPGGVYLYSLRLQGEKNLENMIYNGRFYKIK